MIGHFGEIAKAAKRAKGKSQRPQRQREPLQNLTVEVGRCAPQFDPALVAVKAPAAGLDDFPIT